MRDEGVRHGEANGNMYNEKFKTHIVVRHRNVLKFPQIFKHTN